ncbi:hypothetical protein [Erysipelothrix rhusiopathiae]|uniref:hypothetical protein n=1 Tax=Erysipelothrix rhusiopathiae TaxID=1648 RepID=UPI000B0C6331|nr:hypothetical protein [Erysipelothrix rhusiopathiae]
MNQKNDTFGHAVLGGAGNALRELILEAGISERAKVQDLSNAQRSHATEQSKVDVEESFKLGMSAHMRSMEPSFTGKMVALKRVEGVEEYDVEFFATDASNVANHVKNFPIEWILPEFAGIAQEAHDYIAPLLVGRPVVMFDEKGLPRQVKPFYMR